MDEEKEVCLRTDRPSHIRDLGVVYCQLVCGLEAAFGRDDVPAMESILADIAAFERLFPEVAEYFSK